MADVLLAVQHARFVPGLAVLAAATQVRDRDEPAPFEEQEVGGVERWRHADVEAAVRGQQHRTIAVARRAARVDQKHRHARAVLRSIPHLLDFIGGAVEAWSGDLRQRMQPARRDLVAIRRRRLDERLKRHQHVVVLGPCVEAREGSVRRQRHVTGGEEYEAAGEGKSSHLDPP